MGKTTWSIRYINGSAHDRVFIFDHQNEFALRFQIPPAKVATDPESFVRLLETERVVPFDFTIHWGGYKEEAFAMFCDLCFDVMKTGLEPQGKEGLFVCDELQQFVNSAQSPVEFKQIMETGRRYNLDTLSLSRAPNRLNVATREEFTELIMFRMDDENSLKFAASVGADVELIAKLQPHEYVYYNVISGREGQGVLEFGGKAKL